MDYKKLSKISDSIVCDSAVSIKERVKEVFPEVKVEETEEKAIINFNRRINWDEYTKLRKLLQSYEGTIDENLLKGIITFNKSSLKEEISSNEDLEEMPIEYQNILNKKLIPKILRYKGVTTEYYDGDLLVHCPIEWSRDKFEIFLDKIEQIFESQGLKDNFSISEDISAREFSISGKNRVTDNEDDYIDDDIVTKSVEVSDFNELKGILKQEYDDNLFGFSLSVKINKVEPDLKSKIKDYIKYDLHYKGDEDQEEKDLNKGWGPQVSVKQNGSQIYIDYWVNV